jgi:hypothetical protein
MVPSALYPRRVERRTPRRRDSTGINPDPYHGANSVGARSGALVQGRGLIEDRTRKSRRAGPRRAEGKHGNDVREPDAGVSVYRPEGELRPSIVVLPIP